MTWSSAPAYDGGVEGSYVFMADTGRYALSNWVMPPQITVTVAGRKPRMRKQKPGNRDWTPVRKQRAVP